MTCHICRTERLDTVAQFGQSARVSDPPICRRCGRAVTVEADRYDVFEQMHYVCFHYEFEHGVADPEVDPDDDCGLPGCPSAPAVRHRDRLVAAIRELLADLSEGPPANWDNRTMPKYLGALVSWLSACDHHYGSRKRPIPWDGWQVVADGLRAATGHE